MKTACILGGSGFIGSHVADKLTEKGFHVRIFDNKQSKWINSKQQMIIGDITDRKDVESAIEGSDFVYNFAAIADLNEGINKPIETIEINVLGNAYALEASRKFKVKRFVYASTLYVYSNEGGFYKCSKKSSEHYVEEFQKSYGLKYNILRYGSLYGPRSDETNGLFRIVKGAIDSGVISYDGDPDSFREYIHVDDAANASVKILGSEFENQSIILTGQEKYRVEDLLKMLEEILGYKSSVQFSKEKQLGHYIRTPYAFQPSNARKYSPSFHIDIGLGLMNLINEIKYKDQNKLGES